MTEKKVIEEKDGVKAKLDVAIDNYSDWFLQNLVNSVNGTEGEFPITISTGGFLVSGNLISGHRYFEKFADAMYKGFSDKEIGEKVRQTFVSYGDSYKPEVLDETTTPPQYFHIDNAKYFHNSGTPIPGNIPILYRGRISMVSGFHMGALAIDKK